MSVVPNPGTTVTHWEPSVSIYTEKEGEFRFNKYINEFIDGFLTVLASVLSAYDGYRLTSRL